MQNNKYTPTKAVLDNIERGIAIASRYPRESIISKRRDDVVELAKSFKADNFTLDTVKQIYNTLHPLVKSLDFTKKLWDSGPTDEVIKFYSHGGASGLAWARMILKQEGILVSHKEDITKAQTEQLGDDSVGTLEVAKALNEELMQVTYVAMKQGVDLHGDYTDITQVRLAKESFNKSLMRANMFHAVMTDKFSIIESYLAPTDMVLNKNLVQEGEWLITLQVHDEDVWQAIKNDDITGVSIGAMASVEDLEN